eukprot:4004234-Pleurochrysis_carterae.AAC.3
MGSIASPYMSTSVRQWEASRRYIYHACNPPTRIANHSPTKVTFEDYILRADDRKDTISGDTRGRKQVQLRDIQAYWSTCGMGCWSVAEAKEQNSLLSGTNGNGSPQEAATRSSIS